MAWRKWMKKMLKGMEVMGRWGMRKVGEGVNEWVG